VSDIEEMTGLVARACRVLGKLDLARGTTGHVSARVGDIVLVRGRGPAETGVRYTEPRDIVAVDLDGRKLGGHDGLDPPIEVFIHTALYRADAATRAIVHAHPRTPVLFTITDTPLLPLYGAYDPSGLRLALDGVPTYPRGVLIADTALGAELARAMGTARACLMRGHGITTCGTSVEEAVDVAIRLTELAEVNYRARLLGEAKPIADEDAATFRAGARSERSWRHDASWRYYCRLTGEDAGGGSPP
jgi:L-fuculose-phosphate aldolase